MNGDILCNSHSITLLSCNNSRSPGHKDEDGEWYGRRLTSTSLKSYDGFSEKKSSQCSPRWPEEPALHQQHQYQHHQQTPCLHACAPTERSLPLGYSISHMPLHNNTSTLSITTTTNTNHAIRQRRAARHKARGKKATLRIADRNSQNRRVTDYFPIRRSSRKSKAELKFEEKRHIDDLITNGIEEGMEVQQIEEKGRGVFSTRGFQKGEYVVEYHGDLLLIPDAKRREAEYAQNPATGCYMYYFQYLDKTYCVDATKETGRMGRLLNHSKTGNCQTKLHDINGVPHLILVASRDIDDGEELLYDYGDRSKESIAAHPWLKY
ncbi:N-lysine methyltransferase KMT5A-A isoform X1 [Gadus macrocephalus]|uniref:N-lysine methyltransferase KMT5A-A isoform X1 n=1 Tax=Gadus macrocephalus TaxID=80720 RepID=UPI0028CB48FF|nr:N-lysine methyltransferase KMT5A-A isoform X1 [Gadus macrocephalus]